MILVLDVFEKNNFRFIVQLVLDVYQLMWGLVEVIFWCADGYSAFDKM